MSCGYYAHPEILGHLPREGRYPLTTQSRPSYSQQVVLAFDSHEALDTSIRPKGEGSNASYCTDQQISMFSARKHKEAVVTWERWTDALNAVEGDLPWWWHTFSEALSSPRIATVLEAAKKEETASSRRVWV